MGDLATFLPRLALLVLLLTVWFVRSMPTIPDLCIEYFAIQTNLLWTLASILMALQGFQTKMLFVQEPPATYSASSISHLKATILIPHHLEALAVILYRLSMRPKK